MSAILLAARHTLRLYRCLRDGFKRRPAPVDSYRDWWPV